MSSTVNSLSSLLTPQASSQATGSATAPSSSPSSNLGESAFLTLLSAELQYQ
ncbi:MAG: flagellar hook capping protein, partial [Sulfobacillus thermotolerans]|nr:flagellar hook capping protein [Sulfobacillus thermotolerans]